MSNQITWRRVANENETVEVPEGSTVRYGASPEDRFVERVVSGRVTADNATFGDPARGTPKGLFLREVAAPAPQPPAPPEPPPAESGPPSINDPDFDRKMRLREFEQRERSIAGTATLAAAQDRAAAAAEQTLRVGIPTDQPMADALNRLAAALEAQRGQ